MKYQFLVSSLLIAIPSLSFAYCEDRIPNFRIDNRTNLHLVTAASDHCGCFSGNNLNNINLLARSIMLDARPIKIDQGENVNDACKSNILYPPSTRKWVEVNLKDQATQNTIATFKYAYDIHFGGPIVHAGEQKGSPQAQEVNYYCFGTISDNRVQWANITSAHTQENCKSTIVLEMKPN